MENEIDHTLVHPADRTDPSEFRMEPPGNGNGKPRKRKGDLVPLPGFDRFWQLWPRKEAKKPAIAAWNKIAPNAGMADRIVAAVERQRPELQARERRYIPLPASWLNEARWEDETGPIGGAEAAKEKILREMRERIEERKRRGER